MNKFTGAIAFVSIALLATSSQASLSANESGKTQPTSVSHTIAGLWDTTKCILLRYTNDLRISQSVDGGMISGYALNGSVMVWYPIYSTYVAAGCIEAN